MAYVNAGASQFGVSWTETPGAGPRTEPARRSLSPATGGHVADGPRPPARGANPGTGSDTPQHQLTTRPVPCTTNRDRHSWFTRGRSAGVTAPTMLSSRSSATLEATTRSDILTQ